jgi:VWFA-related protein
MYNGNWITLIVFSAAYKAMNSVWLLLIAIAVPPNTDGSPQGDVVIRSTTRLVQVHIIARDPRGNAVTDLKKEDLQVFDNNKERPITSFFVDAGTPSDETCLRCGNHSSTQLEREYTAILLDWLNGGFFDRLRGNEAVRRALTSMQLRQKVAVFALGARPPNSPHPLTMLSNFSDATNDLPSMIPDPLASSWPAVELAEKTENRYAPLNSAEIQAQVFDWTQRLKETIRAVSELADYLSGLRGRKSLIWLSNGFPQVVDGNVVRGARSVEFSCINEVHGLITKLNRFDIVVQTINTQGLSTGGRSFNDTLLEFAERTGGTAFHDRNDLDAGVRTAFNDLDAGYTLGFPVSEDSVLGTHRIRVSTRRPSVKLHFRDSYELHD